MTEKFIVSFSVKEKKMINQLESILFGKERHNELDFIENNINALNELVKSISLYPSILGKQNLGENSRSIETLVDNLCLKDVMGLVLNIPTKAILGQGFAIAKINFFFMLLYLTRENKELHENEASILEIITNNVFALMAEEVFLSIISDKNVSLHIRTNAGYMLANIWEYRVDHGVKEFAPLLLNIWNARKKIKPVFGTMLGISELFNLSREADSLWLEYLQKEDLDEGELDALQEFLMGLTYEEMDDLQTVMEISKKKILTVDDIYCLIGDERVYPDYKSDDPREFYRSFLNRKNNAFYRAKSNLDGPKKSLEEYLMCFLLSRPEDWSTNIEGPS